jgi:hypothetical protein
MSGFKSWFTRRSTTAQTLLAAGAILVAIIVLAAVFGGGGSDNSAQTSTATTRAHTVETTASTTAPPTTTSTTPATTPKSTHRRHHHAAPPKPAPAPAAALPASYFGLGATVARWKAQNPSFPPGRIPLGLFSYTIDQVSHGRVIAATVEVNARPKFGGFELASSFAMPDDKDPLNSNPSCRLWRSDSLEQAVGLPYIISVADTSARTAHAELRASKPSCS